MSCSHNTSLHAHTLLLHHAHKISFFVHSCRYVMPITFVIGNASGNLILTQLVMSTEHELEFQLKPHASLYQSLKVKIAVVLYHQP